MSEQLQELLDGYWAWLKDRTALREVGDWVEITTPYLDRHNDYLQIYARREGNQIQLTDDSYILQDLEQSGCELNSKRRQDLLQMVLNGFGVQLRDHALTVEAAPATFALKKHNLLQAMLAVNDLFVVASGNVQSLFYEDVELWLQRAHIRYVPRIKLTGKSGYDHLFDFVIPASVGAPERLVETINHPDKSKAESVVFAWLDTRESRGESTRLFTLLNDAERPPPREVLAALESYEVQPVVWSQRDRVLEELAA